MKKPRHIGIILDGNRRFAKRLMAKPWQGHEFGAKKVSKFLEWCSELGIKEVTLYTFSIDNFHRPAREFKYLMKLFKEGFNRVQKSKKIHEQKIRINFLGRLNMFPKDVRKSMLDLANATKNYSNYLVNFCMAYGGRQEIVDAARQMVADVGTGKIKATDINEENFEKYLYTSHEPDLIIRTGGEKRSSNFLIYQGTYSEWFYLDCMWPEFKKSNLVACLKEYESRDRRFGR